MSTIETSLVHWAQHKCEASVRKSCGPTLRLEEMVNDGEVVGVEPKIGGFTPKSSICSLGFPWNKPSICS